MQQAENAQQFVYVLYVREQHGEKPLGFDHNEGEGDRAAA